MNVPNTGTSKMRFYDKCILIICLLYYIITYNLIICENRPTINNIGHENAVIISKELCKNLTFSLNFTY